MMTVAVASYNHEKYVKECAESILEQDCGDMELCWVDDNSSDGTYEIVKRILSSGEFIRKFERIAVRRNNVNRGAAFSLNSAARMGQGELISFMNSDDYYAPDRLRSCIRSYSGEEFFLWFSNVMPVDEGGISMVCDPTGERIAFDADILVKRFGGVGNALLYRQIASSTGNFSVSRNLFVTLGGFQNLRYCHDWMFALHASRLCEPIMESARLYFYRLHQTNSFRSLGGIAERETGLVLSSFFESVALKAPINALSPCPRKFPAGFWELVEATGTKSVAERVFFPYTRKSRLLSRANPGGC